MPGARHWLAAVAFGWLAASGAVLAQDATTAPSPILTLDQERLFGGSHAAERITAEIEARGEELANENRRIEGELTAEELDLTSRRATLPAEEFRTLAEAFDAKVQRIRAEQDAKTRDLAQLRDEAEQLFLRRITPILAEIVRERGAVAVLDRRTVILSADSIDITDEAIARINNALDTDPVVAPGDPAVLAPANGDGN